MEEKTYLADNNITVTNARIIIGSTIYALRNISSVNIHKILPSRGTEIFLISFGVIIPFFSFCSSRTEIILTFVCIGLLMIILGIILAITNKAKYSVRISSNAGEKNAFVSENRDYIEQIINAINTAIVEYR